MPADSKISELANKLIDATKGIDYVQVKKDGYTVTINKDEPKQHKVIGFGAQPK